MIHFYKNISVSTDFNKKIHISNGLVFETNSVLNDINFNYMETNTIIEKISELYYGNLLEFEWGGNLGLFLSTKDKTIIQNLIFNEPDIEIPTSEILSMLLERKAIMDNWTKEKLLDEVKKGFNKLKGDPMLYSINEFAKQYKVQMKRDDSYLIFSILDNEINLSTEEFIKLIVINEDRFKFLPQ